jgi:hypothetical protein
MHLRIDSHSGFAKGPAPPTREPSRLIPAGHAGCPGNLSYETPSQSQRKRPLYVLLNDDLRLSRIPDSNRNSRMHVDPHISQPTECRPNPFVTFSLSHPFSIHLFDASERKHSPLDKPKHKDTVPPWIRAYPHSDHLTQIQSKPFRKTSNRTHFITKFHPIHDYPFFNENDPPDATRNKISSIFNNT